MNKASAFFQKIGGMIKSVWTEVTTHWSQPNKEKGEYISYKEFTSFCIGATCSNSVGILTGYISFAASCLLVGAIYGISFKDIYLISFINLPLAYIINPINMLIQDNLGNLSKRLKILVHTVCIAFLVVGGVLMFIPQTYFEQLMPAFPQVVGVTLIGNALLIYFRILMWKTLTKRFGKFRPWVMAGAIPCIVCLCLMVYLPFKSYPYATRLWVLYALFTLYNTFIGFSQQIGNLQNVMSPNTEERGKLMSIGCFVYSSVPSLVSILLPIFATMLGGFTDLRTYRILFPIAFAVFAAGIIFFFGFAVKEKVFINENHKANVNLKTGFKEVLKNKYFWISKLSGLGNAITVGSVALTNVIIIYSLRAEWLIGVYAGIVGTASVPGLLLAPILMKKFGKKNIMLLSKLTTIITNGLLIISVYTDSFILMLLFMYLQILLVAPSGVAGSAMTADIWDYQQWKSGERLDGCSGIFDLIIQPFTILGGMCIPAIYAAVGFTSDWDILYVGDYRNKILLITILVGAAANLIAAIPYFFYDLTDAKHRAYMEEIRKREGLADAEADEAVKREAAAGELSGEQSGADVGTLYLPDDEDVVENGEDPRE